MMLSKMPMPAGMIPTFDAASLALSGVADPYRLLVEATDDYAFFMLDLSGRVTSWNAGAERIQGYRTEEIVGRPASLFYPEDAAEGTASAHDLGEARQLGRFEQEGWRVRKDRSRFWASVVIHALRRADGEIVGFSQVTRDLTSKRQSEFALQQLQCDALTLSGQLGKTASYLKDVVDASDRVAMIAADVNGVITMFNRGAERLLGYRSQEVVGRMTPLRFLTGLPNAPVGAGEVESAGESTPSIELLWKRFGGGSQEHEDQTYLRRDGKEVIVSRSVSVVKGRGGVKLGLLIIAMDVTETRELERRTDRERQLREKRVEALSHMAAGISHEISNPLAIIHMAADDLLSAVEAGEPVEEEARRAAKIILTTADRAMKILRGLRGFTREASKDPLLLASMENIVRGCLDLQETRFTRHGIQLIDVCPEGLPEVLCREVQISQILTNLLNNAFDAVSPEVNTERWVKIEVSQAEQALVLKVTDSGPGIAEQDRPHVLEPFFTTKQLGAGTGIGLSLSRTIAEDHGGSLVLAESRMGACFCLSLPLPVGEEKPA